MKDPGFPGSCVKDTGCWPYDCLVSMPTSSTHCDITRLARESHLPILTWQWMLTVMLWSSDMEHLTCWDKNTTTFTIKEIVHSISDGNIFIKTSQDQKKQKKQWAGGSWFMRSLHWILAKSLIRAAHSWEIWLRSNSGIWSLNSKIHPLTGFCLISKLNVDNPLTCNITYMSRSNQNNPFKHIHWLFAYCSPINHQLVIGLIQIPPLDLSVMTKEK